MLSEGECRIGRFGLLSAYAQQVRYAFHIWKHTRFAVAKRPGPPSAHARHGHELRLGLPILNALAYGALLIRNALSLVCSYSFL